MVKMFERHARATFIVDRHCADRLGLERPSGNDRGHLPFREVGQELDVGDQPVRHNDESFNASIEKHFEIAFEAQRFVVSVGKQGKIIRLIQGILDAAQDRGAERIRDIENHHADNVGALAAERARQGIRTIAKTTGGGFDA